MACRAWPMAAWTPRSRAAGPGQQMAEKAPPNALAITEETLAPFDAGERDTPLTVLNKLRGAHKGRAGGLNGRQAAVTLVENLGEQT
jgi:hypothetical protein